MLSQEENRLFTETGPGSPCGELLRRYWMPICPAAELTPEKPKKRVRMLGEDLVLFRDGKGRLGLVAEQCAHRRASLYYGFVEEDGLRCAYHGWKYDVSGQCIEQPFEPAASPLKQEACQRAYRVEQLAGILFAYLGPQPAPLLPRWETLVRQDGKRRILVLPEHRCNWLQAQENSVDPVHTFYLHGHMLRQQNLDKESSAYYNRPMLGFEFELCNEPAWTGIRKSRIYGGEFAEREIGHPAIFPNILFNPQYKKLVGSRMLPRELVTHWRVPIDDTHTYIICLCFAPSYDGTETVQEDEDIPVTTMPHPLKADVEYDLTLFEYHDLMAWETQGPVYDRSRELLGTSDRGIVMFRKLLKEQLAAIAAGKDPVGIIRDPEINREISLHLLEEIPRELQRAGGA